MSKTKLKPTTGYAFAANINVSGFHIYREAYAGENMVPVLVIPLTAESVENLVRKAEQGSLHLFKRHFLKPTSERGAWENERNTLAAIGIKVPRKL